MILLMAKKENIFQLLANQQGIYLGSNRNRLRNTSRKSPSLKEASLSTTHDYFLYFIMKADGYTSGYLIMAATSTKAARTKLKLLYSFLFIYLKESSFPQIRKNILLLLQTYILNMNCTHI